MPLMQLSTNAFKTVLDIDLMGSWNVLKATVPYLLASAAKYKKDGKTGKSPSNEPCLPGRLSLLTGLAGKRPCLVLVEEFFS